jgi:hypothetical protein
VKSESRKNTQNSLYLGLGLNNIIAIPFPVSPRCVRHGQIAKILDFSAWKSCHKSEAGDSTNETLEQINDVEHCITKNMGNQKALGDI